MYVGLQVESRINVSVLVALPSVSSLLFVPRSPLAGATPTE